MAFYSSNFAHIKASLAEKKDDSSPHPCNGVTGGQTFIEKQHETQTQSHMIFSHFSRRIRDQFTSSLKRIWILILNSKDLAIDKI